MSGNYADFGMIKWYFLVMEKKGLLVINSLFYLILPSELILIVECISQELSNSINIDG